jgi:DNA-binding response OmpR family regulator
MSKILVVEDEKTLNEAYQLILKKDGHDIVAAYDGKQALDLFSKEKPDLILLDLRMPKLDGISFLKKIDLSNNGHKTKVIIAKLYTMLTFRHWFTEA